MSFYHCPQCDITFEAEEAEAVFCPDCETVICEEVEDSEDAREEKRKRISDTIGTFGCCGLIAYAIFAVIMPFAFETKPNPFGFIMMGPLWCLFSIPIFRHYIKGYSWQIGLLSMLWWLLSFTILWIIAFCIFGKVEAIREWTLKSTLLCLLPGATIAFVRGWSEHFFWNLSNARYSSWRE